MLVIACTANTPKSTTTQTPSHGHFSKRDFMPARERPSVACGFCFEACVLTFRFLPGTEQPFNNCLHSQP